MNEAIYTELHGNLFHDMDAFKKILSGFPEQERLDALKVKDTLATAASNGKLHLVLQILPENDRLLALSSVYSTLPKSSEYLENILKTLPNNTLLKIISEVDKEPSSFLQYFAREPECLKVIFNALPEEKHLEVLKLQNKNNFTLFHYAAVNLDSLKFLTELYEQHEPPIQAMKCRTDTGDYVLQEARTYYPSLVYILSLFNHNQEDILEALGAKNKSGNTMLHSLAHGTMQNYVEFKFILEQYPADKRIDAIRNKNASGKSVLDLLDAGIPGQLTPKRQCIIQLLPLDSGYSEALKDALLDKLEKLEKRKNEYNHFGLFKYVGAFSRTQEVDAIVKFFKGTHLDKQDIKALTQGEIGEIFQHHLKQTKDEIINCLESNPAVTLNTAPRQK